MVGIIVKDEKTTRVKKKKKKNGEAKLTGELLFPLLIEIIITRRSARTHFY